jgi:hypothetical protein
MEYDERKEEIEPWSYKQGKWVKYEDAKELQDLLNEWLDVKPFAAMMDKTIDLVERTMRTLKNDNLQP